MNGKAVAARIWKDVKNLKWVWVVFGLYSIVIKYVTGAFCPIVILTGIPCPGCGLTRAALFFATGQFKCAMWANPTIFLWMAFAVYGFIQRYLCNRRIHNAAYLLGGIALIMIMVYCCRMAVMFPDRAPMTINQENLLSQIFPAYRGFLQRL